MQYMVPFPQKMSENHQEKVPFWIYSENEEMCQKTPTNQANPRKKKKKKESG